MLADQRFRLASSCRIVTSGVQAHGEHGPVRMDRDQATPQAAPGIAGPGGAVRVDLAAVLLHSSVSRMTELGDLYARENLDAGPVQPEDVVGADEVNAEESVVPHLERYRRRRVRIR